MMRFLNAENLLKGIPQVMRAASHFLVTYGKSSKFLPILPRLLLKKLEEIWLIYHSSNEIKEAMKKFLVKIAR
jgi:hypothetical protein